MDTFAKYETALDGSCRKNERLFTELKAELNSDLDLEIDLGPQGGNVTQSVEKYLQNFNWNDFRFKMQDKPLSVLGANVYSTQKRNDESLKKRQDTQAKIK